MFSKILDALKQILPINVLIIGGILWNLLFNITNIVSTSFIHEYVIRKQRNEWSYTYYVDFLNIALCCVESIFHIVVGIIILHTIPPDMIKKEEVIEEKNMKITLDNEDVINESREILETSSDSLFEQTDPIAIFRSQRNNKIID